MKKWGYALLVGSMTFICVLPLLAATWQNGTSTGNESQTQLPKLWERDGSFNADILMDCSEYFSDHFGFRHEMITLHERLVGSVFQTLESDRVLLGKEGWLFYKDTLDDYTGATLFTRRQIYSAAHTLELLQECCQQNGIDFYFTVAPNKNTIYADKMPARYKNSSIRNCQLLQRQLDLLGVQYVDLLESLTGARQQVYYQWDSHWNMQGAQLAAQTLLQEIEGKKVIFDILKTEKECLHKGDLYEMVYPSGQETEFDAKYAFDYTYSKNFRSAEDITIRTNSTAASGSIYVYRDSFGINLHPFFAQYYANACFSRKMPYCMVDILAEQPDILLVELVERNLKWLLERPPELPAPQRFGVQVSKIIDNIAVLYSDSQMDGYFCFAGNLKDKEVDVDSPIYVFTETAVYEASPCGGGEQPFTAYLPEKVRKKPLYVAFRSGGRMVCGRAINKS